MKTLIIDTASNLEIIALCSGEECAEASEFVGTSHSLSLLDNVDRCLKKLNIPIRDLDLIGVGIGPGSFTGIRIAVSTCRMLAQVLGKPLVGIKTHLLYAVSVEASTRNDNIIIAFDAKKGRVFGALYKRGEALCPQEILPPGDYPIQKILESVDQSHMTYMTGSGIEKYWEHVDAVIENKLMLHDFIPGGKAMCDLVFNLYAENTDNYTDFSRVTPFYGRKSDAEANKDRKGGNSTAPEDLFPHSS